MKKSYNLLFLMGLLIFRSSLWAQSTAFTYQGQLATAGQPANGNYDLTFALFNASTGGSAAAGPLETDAVAISNGLFTIVLDFGSGIFDGTSYWLEIGVRTNGDSSFTTLSPRQALTPTPYAIYAQGADATGLEGAIPTSSLSGAYDQPVTFNNTGNSFSGDGSGLTGLNASQLTGGTVPDAQLSTNVALLDGDQVFSGSNLFSGVVQLTNAANTIAGSFQGDGSGLSNLTVNAANLVGTLPATQLAGPLPASLLAGTFTNPVAFNNPANSLSGDGSGLTGVDAATLQGMAASQFLTSTGDGGGLMNLSPENISPGTANIDITGNANTANYTGTASNAPGSPFALDVKGDQTNEGGIYVNNACGLLYGGVHLWPDGGITTGGYLSVANNTHLFEIPASSQAMVEIGCDVPNGIVTYCGQPFLVHFDQVAYGLATSCNFPSGCNTFTIGKYGQVVLNNPLSQSWDVWEPEFESPQLVFQSEVLTNLGEWGPTNYWGISQVSNVFTIGPMIGINNHMNGVDAGCTRSYVEGSVLPAIVITTNGDVGIGTASPNNTLEVAGTVSATSFINSSDRNLKGGFRQVNAQEVLEAVAALPIQRWHFLRDVHTQHIGPMAQDFRAAFKVGPDDKHIDTVDAAGVALAAIQGLNQKLAEELKQKQTEITELRRRLDKLEQLLTAKSGGKKDYTRRGNDKFSVGYYVKDGAIIKKHSLLADKDDPVSNLDLDIVANGEGFDSVIATGKETDLTLTGTISASDNGDGKNASDFSGLGVQIVASDCAKVKVHSMKIDTEGFLRAANAPVDGYVATAAGTGGATAWQQGSSGANSGTASVSVAAISNPTNSVPHSVGIQHLNPAPWMGYNNWYNAYSPYLKGNTNWMYYIAQLMVNSGMVAAGYDTIVFDSGWFNPTRDTNGLLYTAPNILVAPYYTNAVSTWPMPNVVADLHAIGIPHVGLYYFDPSTVPNAANQLRHPENLPIELDADTFASWGVDYVKFDAVNLTNNDLQYLRRFSTEFLKKVPQGRIQMGVASGVNLDAIPCSLDWCGSYQAVADGLADDLREAPKGYDWVDWGTLIFLHSLDNAVYFNSKYSHRGVFCSADALPLQAGYVTNMHAVLSAAAVASVPLQVGQPADPSLGAAYTSFMSLVLNQEMIDLDRDTFNAPFLVKNTDGPATSYRGVGIVPASGYSIYAKQLGSPVVGIAIAVVNRVTNGAPTAITINWSDICTACSKAGQICALQPGQACAVRDVWAGTNGFQTNSWTYTLAPIDGALLKIYPLLSQRPRARPKAWEL